ncbi:hypothetical protein I4U23_014308 [Adineta vaga]|nr:hypothetical protein I4U23_014308 [Adineta vaga]
MIDKMINNRVQPRSRDYSNVSTIDRLAANRTQHLQSRENRSSLVTDNEIDVISDWSDSDREYDLLSDFESITSCLDNDPKKNYKHMPYNKENQLTQNISPLTRPIETSVPFINDSDTSTQISFVIKPEKPRQRYVKNQSINTIQARNKYFQTPLLPGRRNSSKQTPSHPSINRSTTTVQPSNSKLNTQNQVRSSLSRENTSNNSFNDRMRTDSSIATHSSFHTNDESMNRGQTTSPDFSHTSISRTYEMKKLSVDDYGRLIDTSNTRSSQPRGRQKWGTIVHPPFPLGYQQVSYEQVVQVVERLTSPVRCRDRHTPLPSATKRYLSIEETDALINRLTKVKTIRTPEQYWPVHRHATSIKTLNNNWKGAGIPA